MPAWLGPAISAGASLLGGLIGKKDKEEDREWQERQLQMQIASQKEFAQQGIRWRVEDAKQAGIHPLYSLGANTHSFSPIGIGSSPGSPMGDALASAGQEIGRAVMAKGTNAERAYNARLMQLQLQRGELENMLLASQIARLRTPSQLPPPMPGGGRVMLDGQAQTGAPIPERFGGVVPNASPMVVNMPMERVLDVDAPFREPGSVADVTWTNTATGGLAPVPSQDAQDRMEDVFGPDISWSWRNIVLPNFWGGAAKPYKAPDGFDWAWSTFDQSWHLVKRKNWEGR